MDAQERVTKQLQFQVIVLSLVLLSGAMAWTWQIGMAANALDHRMDHAAQDIQGLRQQIQKLEGKRA